VDEQHHVKRVTPIEQGYDEENQYVSYEPWHWTVWCNVFGGALGWGEKEEEGGITIGGTWWILCICWVAIFCCEWQRWRRRIVYCSGVGFRVYNQLPCALVGYLFKLVRC